ncbi:MAG: serine/threonine-protein kinase [Planctomycetota bacterium]|nr:serine/threonine-protein kinase [Planctomycetota bacterium]MDA0932690.1 serine/threonine-protein kinase [Planctomycetota bacterium]
MTGNPDRLPADEQASAADLRMAGLLADGFRPSPDLRRALRLESGEEADDILGRINVLDFLDSVVGDVGNELPERLGDYRIIGLLGRGGMGTVFEAYQESLERVVALKVLAPSRTADPRMRKRFRTEARANANLHHQHILPVFGFGEAAGHLYFTMERVEGVSLDRHVATARRRGQAAMEPRDAARRFAGVADALAHAHRRGILHRDVKPGNILVQPDGSLCLADFGLSKVVGEDSLSVSEVGAFVGTLHYASPEQARGQELTPASDLYALAVTLYQCVSGKMPIDAETTEAMLDGLLNRDPLPLRRVLPHAPRDLEIVLDKLLSKDPRDRYPDGESLARDLQRIADDEPVLVRRRSWPSRAWRVVRKHRVLSATIAVAVLLLAVVLVLWRQVLVEEEAVRSARYESLLAAAISRAETEPGRPDGPDGLLAVLTGMAPETADQGTEVLDLLGRADLQADGETRARDLRSAYLDDPVPAATAALREGRGQAARALLDAAIAAEESRGFLDRDSVTWMRLYRLYLARAVASLTASVADQEGAAADLLRASFVRPGAFAPAILSALVRLEASESPSALLAVCDRLIGEAPPGGDAVVLGVLRALVAPVRPGAANLMPFSLSKAARRRVLRWLDVEDGGAALQPLDSTPWAGGIETSLADAAQRGFAGLSDTAALRAALLEGRALLGTEIAAGSPLQAWSVVFDVIEGALPALLARMNTTAGMRQVVDGLVLLTRLDVPAELLRRSQDGLERVLGIAEASGQPTEPIRVALWMALGDPAAALAEATDWVGRAADDADAYLARARCRIELGDVTYAAFDGAQAIGLALDPDSVRARFVAMLEEAVARGGEDAQRFQALSRSFAGSD